MSINYLITSKGKAPDHFNNVNERARLVLVIERILEDEGFDDIDTTFNQTAGNIVPHGARLFTLEEGYIQAGKNGVSIICTVMDAVESRMASRNGNGFFGISLLRADGGEELLACIIVQQWERFRHLGDENKSSEIGFYIRDQRRGGTDDNQFVRGLWMEPGRLHIDHMEVFLGGQYVGGTAGITNGLDHRSKASLTQEMRDDDARAIIRSVLEKMKQK